MYSCTLVKALMLVFVLVFLLELILVLVASLVPYYCVLVQLLSMLNTTTPPASQTGCKSALSIENLSKNRSQHIIPLDNMQRPYLMTYIPGESAATLPHDLHTR